MSRLLQHAARRPRTFTTLAAVGALATAALPGSPAIASAAQPAAAAPQTVVYYSLRDLATDRGTRALYERIVSAARRVCPGNDSRDLADFADSRQCQRQAVARAIHQIGSPRLAALHMQATSRHG